MTKDYAKNRSKLTPITPRRNMRYAQNNAPSAGLPGWAWMLCGLLFGIAISTFLFWKLKPAPVLSLEPTAYKEQTSDSQANAGKNLSQKSQVTKRNKTIKMLDTVKMSNIANKDEPLATLSDQADLKDAIDQTQPVHSQHAKTNLSAADVPVETRFDFYTLLPTISVDSPDKEGAQATIQRTTPYIIQTGSFKTPQQAEQLKASLALQGLEARIQTVTVNPSESWYRVYIGPFNTKAEALNVQRGLENLDDQSIDSVILKMRV